jgi:spore coat protein U-like protein
VVCNASTNDSVPLTISLDNGSNGGLGPTTRYMINGTNKVQYGLYQDSAYATSWGSGSAKLTTNVTAVSTTFNVYGEITAAAPAAIQGSYSDTVTITITY